MKTHRFAHLVAATFSLAALSTAGCTEKERIAAVPLSPAGSAATIAVPESTTPVQVAPVASPTPALAQWTDIESITFDRRAQFFAGLKGLEARVEAQNNELKAIRAAMKNTVAMQDWDFAMKEMADARSYLMSMGEEARKATSETWDQQKAKVGQAWKRTQAAYDKVKASTTG